jgi:disulfide bond formation protein DsbB
MISWGSVGIAVFLQFYYELTPCPLCIFSRIILMGIGFIYWAWLIQTLLFKKTTKRHIHFIYFALIGLGLLSGLGLSGYHIWLMNLPPEKIPSCGPDLSYLLETLPLYEVIIEAFKGSGSCAQDTWRLFGLNLAQLELGVFGLLTGAQIYILKLIKILKS